MSFRDKLIKLRTESKLSQQELADLLDVSRQTVSRWEAGKNTPSTAQIANICRAFGLQANDLMETASDVANSPSDERENIAGERQSGGIYAADNAISGGKEGGSGGVDGARGIRAGRALFAVIGILLALAVGGLIVTIVYAVKDAAYDTSSTVWVASIPENTPFIVLSVFITALIAILAALFIYLWRSRRR